jgi:hypothetical protein
MTDVLWLAVALLALVVLGGLWLARERWIHRRRRGG